MPQDTAHRDRLHLKFSQSIVHEKKVFPEKPDLPHGAELAWFNLANDKSPTDYFNIVRGTTSVLTFQLLECSEIDSGTRFGQQTGIAQICDSVLLEKSDRPTDLMLREINNRIASSSALSDLKATLVLGTVNLTTGRVEISSAGHPSPLLLRSDKTLSDIVVAGPPLGAALDTRYQANTARLMPGDAVLVYSTGVTNCLNRLDRKYGQRRFRRDLIQTSEVTAGKVVENIEERLQHWLGDKTVTDDATLAVIGFSLDFPITIET